MPGPLHRDARGHPLDPVGLAVGGVDLGVDQTRPDSVDADALSPDLLGQADRHRVEGALRGGVVDPLTRPAQPGGDGGDVDDDPALAAVEGRHAPHGLAGAEERADDVDGRHPPEPLRRQFVDPPLLVGDAGVVDQGGDPAEAGGGLEQGGDLVGLGDVALHGQRLGSGRLAGRHHPLGRVGGGQVGEAHRPPLGRQPPGRGRADSPAPARHHRHPSHHPMLSAAVDAILAP